MKSLSKEAILKVANELNLPFEVVLEAYVSYYRFIKEKIEELPFEQDLTEEEFSKLRTNFNLPSLGKLTCTWRRYQGMKKYKKISKSKFENENKKD